MANQFVNKVIYNGNTIIDLTDSTIEEQYILDGYKGYDKSGAQITGTCTFDSDTTDATAVAGDILATKTAYVNGNKVTGTIPNKGKTDGEITTKSGEYTIPFGLHDGSGKVKISETEQAKIVEGNIKSGITILGVTGTMTGAESITSQAKTVTPSATGFVVTPDAGTDYLSQVTVSAIPYSETDNVAGGKTVTIATVTP